MSDLNFGSGAALLGDTSALQQAMNSRGVDSSVLSQVSSASAIPPTSTPASLGSPNTTATSNAIPQSVGGNTGGAVPQGEAQVILKALTERLKNLSKNGL